MEYRSTFTILREQPEVLKQAGVAMGALLGAFGIHTRSSTALMAGGVSGMTAADAGFYGGVLSASVFLAAALVVGWIGGGWILQSAPDAASPVSALRPAWRKLTVVGVALVAGIAFDAWPLVGGLIMVVGAGAGAFARARLFAH